MPRPRRTGDRCDILRPVIITGRSLVNLDIWEFEREKSIDERDHQAGEENYWYVRDETDLTLDIGDGSWEIGKNIMLSGPYTGSRMGLSYYTNETSRCHGSADVYVNPFKLDENDDKVVLGEMFHYSASDEQAFVADYGHPAPINNALNCSVSSTGTSTPYSGSMLGINIKVTYDVHTADGAGSTPAVVSWQYSAGLPKVLLNKHVPPPPGP